MMQALDTWAHLNRWHLRVWENMFLAGGLLILAMILPPVPGSVFVLVVSLSAATAGAGVPLRVMVRFMCIPLLFLTVGSLPLSVTIQNAPESGWSVGWSPEGMRVAAETALRALGACSALLFLAGTTPVSSQIAVFRRLYVPETLLDVMSLTYRLLFLFDSLLTRMIIAQGGRLGYRNTRTGCHTAAIAVSALLVRTLVRAQAMERGLAARGYDGRLRVLDTVAKPSFRRLGVCSLALGAVFAAGFVWNQVAHG
jgi:cobalt/nickel transport system permease protein